MKTFDLIIIILTFLFLLSLLFYLIYGKITERKFDVIAKKFAKQFGYMPFSMAVGKSGGFFFWGYKESYLICALFFTKFPATKKSLTPQEINFFKNLNRAEISWFYIKYIAIVIGLLSFIGLLVMFKLQAA
ncbi:hypothetical protein MUA04_19595 [Enterobacteriaceae bacterium H11S18]|uniref:hypothetical protein n=1 Tax=Dryocola clanedunensis TaxID=2925396 RepID=UPI0022F11E08|nr:hypothetical protein [Dryocola clanedunensis]MCT4712376.1 hypothetical protein [Dryocola clanedunensis]